MSQITKTIENKYANKDISRRIEVVLKDYCNDNNNTFH